MSKLAEIEDSVSEEDVPKLTLALVFHDIESDEEKSAEFAKYLLKFTIRPELTKIISDVEALILSTNHFSPCTIDKSLQELANMVKDADLSVLGGTASEFRTYDKKVVQEIFFKEKEKQVEGSNKLVSEIINGRLLILQDLYSRPTIFRTPYMSAKYEKIAKENLRQAVSLYRAAKALIESGYTFPSSEEFNQFISSITVPDVQSESV